MSVDYIDNPMLNMKIPDFDAVKPELFEAALSSMLEAGESLLANVSADFPDEPKWDELIEPFLHFNMRLNKLVSLASHLDSVLDDMEWRNAFSSSIQKVSSFSTRWAHSKEIYQLFKSYQQHGSFHALEREKQHLVNDYVRDVELEGVNLPKSKQLSLQKINQALSKANQDFQNNVLDATDDWQDPRSRMELLGVPVSVLETLDFDDNETYVVNLKSNVVQGVLSHAKSPAVRESIYKAFVTRGSDIGPSAKKYDNTRLITDILQNRHEMANILGFPTYAHLSLASKDASSPEKVIMFLEELGEKAKKYAEQEKTELLEFAKDKLNISQVNHWDLAFISEKMKEQNCGYSEEEISEYFPVDHVLSCLLYFASELFGVKFVVSRSYSKYDPGVYTYYALDNSGEVLGHIYFDLFARKGKKGGAWVSSFQDRADFVSESFKPIVFLVCNFSQADEYGAGLLNHSDVVTLFHEFGHALHCMLTEIKTYGVSGFSGVAWDLVEWPSQWMETWCWTTRVLDCITSHYKNKQVMPLDMVEYLNNSRVFQSGMFVTKQVQYALTDILIHSSEDPLDVKQAQDIYNSVAERFSVWPLYSEQRFLHAFSHIFAGGYAAGYYSYLWSEAMVADSFWGMGDHGSLELLEIGSKFKDHVLSRGAMLKVEPAFRGMFNRPMDPSVLLKHLGLS